MLNKQSWLDYIRILYKNLLFAIIPIICYIHQKQLTLLRDLLRKSEQRLWKSLVFSMAFECRLKAIGWNVPQGRCPFHKKTHTMGPRFVLKGILNRTIFVSGWMASEYTSLNIVRHPRASENWTVTIDNQHAHSCVNDIAVSNLQSALHCFHLLLSHNITLLQVPSMYRTRTWGTYCG